MPCALGELDRKHRVAEPQVAVVTLSCPLLFSVSANAPADTAVQIRQLSPWEVSHRVAVQPALIAQAFEFAVKLGYCASLCGWFWDV